MIRERAIQIITLLPMLTKIKTTLAESVGAHMLICIYATKSIQIYFGIFFDFILVLLSFHCSHTIPFFSKFFPIFLLPFYSLQKPVTLTWHCWFCFRLSARVPTRRAESNCIIRAHLGALSGVEAGGGNRVYAGWDTHSHFPSSMFWQSLRRWEPIVSFPLLY